MPREDQFVSIILKKQPYGEGDELVTFFTRDSGKLRALAKSTKLPKSKLQYGLQVLFLSRLRLTQGRLPKIIGAECLKTFSDIRQNLESVNVAFYILEIVLKFTPDEQKNEGLFDLMENFLSFLDRSAGRPVRLAAGLAKFKIDFLDSVGLAVHADPPADIAEVGFSNSRGGFVFSGSGADLQRLKAGTFQTFEKLKNISFAELLEQPDGGDVRELQEILSGFLEYHLERSLKSERFL